MREMLKLQLEIGRESREVELGRLRSEMHRIREGPLDGGGRDSASPDGSGGGFAPYQPLPPLRVPGDPTPEPYAREAGGAGARVEAARAAAADRVASRVASFRDTPGAGGGADTPASVASKGGSDRSKGGGRGSRRRAGGGLLTPVVEENSPMAGTPPVGVSPGGRSEYSIASGSGG
jgi:hypothetical protein